MCLVTDQKEPIILTEDLNVVKLFKYNSSALLTSPFQEFVYIQNFLYQTNIRKSSSKFFFDEIDENCLIVNYGVDWNKNSNIQFLGRGFHSISNTERVRNQIIWNRSLVYNTIIPAGSEVYYGVDKDLIISNQIIIKDRYEKEKTSIFI